MCDGSLMPCLGYKPCSTCAAGNSPNSRQYGWCWGILTLVEIVALLSCVRADIPGFNKSSIS